MLNFCQAANDPIWFHDWGKVDPNSLTMEASANLTTEYQMTLYSETFFSIELLLISLLVYFRELLGLMNTAALKELIVTGIVVRSMTCDEASCICANVYQTAIYSVVKQQY